MFRFLLGRLAQSALVLGLAVSVVFALLRAAPGDPLSGSTLDATTAPATRELLRRQYALDRPLLEQYAHFVGSALRGELGMSLSRGRPVAQVLRDVVPNSVLLMGTGLFLGILGGIALGAWQGSRDTRSSATSARVARMSERIGLAIIATPEYIVATAMLTLFAATWRLFPIGGMVSLGVHDSLGPVARAGDVLWHLTLPALTLALIVGAGVARYQRTEMRLVLARPFIRTARAKGVPEARVLVHHALRNALGPVITLCGLLLPSLVGGAVFVEAIFAWPGMGRTMVEAVTGRDYPLAIGAVIVSSVLVALGGLLADVAAAVADPRLARGRR
ncbi:MAG: ABC transporter permease [bacterium]